MSSAVPARRFFFLLLIAATALLALVILPLASALFLAATFAGAAWPLRQFLARSLGGRPRLSAGALVLGVVVVIIGPLVLFSAFAISEGAAGYEFLTRTLRSEAVTDFVDRLPSALNRLAQDGLDQFAEGGDEIGARLEEHTTQSGTTAVALGATLSATGSLMFQTVMMLIAFYFFLVHGAEIIVWLDDLSPLEPGQTRELLAEFKSVSLTVLLSMVVTSTVQTAAAFGGYLLAGVPHAFFFTGLTFFAAFVPAIGAGGICLGAALLLFATGHPHAALFLGLWGLLVVGLVDNLIKPLLMKSGIHMNAAVIFFALIGGLAAFGGVGLLLGPLVVALFLSLVRMYQRDFRPVVPGAHGQVIL